VLQQLIEEAGDLYDCVALLWAVSGEAPGKEWLANINDRGTPLISESRNLFWTRVTTDRKWLGKKPLAVGRPRNLSHVNWALRRILAQSPERSVEIRS
jgi:hypothetical protein